MIDPAEGADEPARADSHAGEAGPRDDDAGTVASPASGEGMYLYGIVRAQGWRLGRGSDEDLQELQHVRFRDIEAWVRATPFVLPPFDMDHVRAHQRTVEAIMRGGTVLPAPYGVVFRGRRQLVGMLQEQYAALDEGLLLLDGHFELRLHLEPAGTPEDSDALSTVASTVYSELRRGARAAVPFPSSGKRLLSAAFLVDRVRWVEFIEECEELGKAHPELSFDVTGPWPAYDFVQIR